MRAAPPPAPLLPLLLLLALLAAPAARARRAESAPAPPPEPEHRPRPSPGPGPGNATRTGSGAPAGGGGGSNSSGDALVTRISSLLRDLPTLKAAVIVACAFSALLIACLLLRVFRWVRLPPSFPRGPTCPASLLSPRAPPHLRAQTLRALSCRSALCPVSPGTRFRYVRLLQRQLSRILAAFELSANV